MIKKKLYSIFDEKVGAYNSPFIAYTDAEAKRNFAAGAMDENSMLAKFPADYTLFRIGEFEELSGTLIPEKANVSLGNALVNRSQYQGRIDLIDDLKTNGTQLTDEAE